MSPPPCCHALKASLWSKLTSSPRVDFSLNLVERASSVFPNRKAGAESKRPLAVLLCGPGILCELHRLRAGRLRRAGHLGISLGEATSDERDHDRVSGRSISGVKDDSGSVGR